MADPRPSMLLEALTLRGIGSYFQGQRLRLGALTILCGGNGSGKSTWLRALKILTASLEGTSFPFELADDLRLKARQFFMFDYTNHRVADSDELESDPVQEREFGHLGTIGLELRVLPGLDLPSLEPLPDLGGLASDTPIRELLISGRCPRDTQVHIRITHPRRSMSETRVLRHGFELHVGSSVVRVLAPHESNTYDVALEQVLAGRIVRGQVCLTSTRNPV